jgi:hypothetical protein
MYSEAVPLKTIMWRSEQYHLQFGVAMQDSLWKNINPLVTRDNKTQDYSNNNNNSNIITIKTYDYTSYALTQQQ